MYNLADFFLESSLRVGQSVCDAPSRPSSPVLPPHVLLVALFRLNSDVLVCRSRYIYLLLYMNHICWWKRCILPIFPTLYMFISSHLYLQSYLPFTLQIYGVNIFCSTFILLSHSSLPWLSNFVYFKLVQYFVHVLYKLDVYINT